MNLPASEIRARIEKLVEDFHQVQFAPPDFVPGQTVVPVAGRTFDHDELTTLVEAALDFWLTAGRFAHQFERDFARYMGARVAALVNSGSSANLLALSALTSPKLGDMRLQPGDEVITAAAGFPTTVNPIVQNGLVPVFVDVNVPSYALDVSALPAALSERTRAIMLAHTLGNPFDLAAITAFCEKHDLWLIEDCCDAVGSTYDGKQVGSFGDLATVSFYPAHHITMGEGGCVLAAKPEIMTLVESFRDWGRDCWCRSGEDNKCGRRFDWQLGELPEGYDHKYTYSHIGYNMRGTDLQAAIGCAQLRKLPGFVEARRRNYATLRDGLRDMEEYFMFTDPTPRSDPSWFGFPLAVRPDSGLSRRNVIAYLEANKIDTRLVFAGNIIRQPAYRDVRHRTIGELSNSDFVMQQSFWIGLHPGLTAPMLEYVLEVFHALPQNVARAASPEPSVAKRVV